jgi:hypothetical protein
MGNFTHLGQPRVWKTLAKSENAPYKTVRPKSSVPHSANVAVAASLALTLKLIFTLVQGM